MLVTWPFVICLICMPSALVPAALGHTNQANPATAHIGLINRICSLTSGTGTPSTSPSTDSSAYQTKRIDNTYTIATQCLEYLAIEIKIPRPGITDYRRRAAP